MKKYLIWSILLALCNVFILSSCGKDDEPEDSTIRLSTYDITFQSEGGTRTVTLESNGYISSTYASATWMSIGHTGSGITISAVPNYNSSSRTGTVEVTNEYGRSATINVIQLGTDNTGGGNDNPGGGNDNKIKAPTNVRAVQNGKTIVVTWDAVEGASRYEVFHASSANGSYSSYGYWTNNRYTDEVVLVTDNYYKIKAIGTTTSEFSDYAYCKYSDNSGSQKPSVPTGLSAVQSGNTIVVSWNSVPNIYYYRLWYSTPSGQEDFTNVYAPTTSAVFDRNMKDGTYRFWIQALNSNYEESDKSSKVSCTYKSNGGGGNQGGDNPSKLETPKNIEAYSSTYFVQISVDEVPLAYEYELYRSKSATSGYTKIPASGGSTASKRYVLTDSNPISGTTYYKVKAKALSYLGIADSDFSSYVKVVR